jgi:hypothetical protein
MVMSGDQLSDILTTMQSHTTMLSTMRDEQVMIRSDLKHLQDTASTISEHVERTNGRVTLLEQTGLLERGARQATAGVGRAVAMTIAASVGIATLLGILVQVVPHVAR